MNAYDHLGMLGKKAKDRVTGVEGVITSLCFDLFGCIQGCLDRGMDKDGKPFDQRWYDVSRLEITDKKPVMKQPDFISGPFASGDKGPAEKPSPRA